MNRKVLMVSTASRCEHPVDVPWDDPELPDAMVALRRER
jgi:hypothetical protein